ncbi:MAG: MgtC/SapB family protein [Spirochaetota bacterium]
MNWLSTLLATTEISLAVITIRLFLSLILAGLIGLEREKHNQPAGLRTHILIGLGSTLLMLVSIYIPQTFRNFQNGDPGRIAAQVVSGIGFLGAGAIIRLGLNIKGLTTAASIWTVAAIGLAVGSGMYAAGLIATAFTLFTLILIDKFEKKIFPQVIMKRLEIVFTGNQIRNEEVLEIFSKFNISVVSYDITQALDKKTSKMQFVVRIPKNTDYKSLYKKLRLIEGIKTVKLE